MPRAGCCPVTVSWSPGSSAASAWSTSRCPPVSRPSPSRPVVAGTDPAPGVVEPGLVDRALELLIALQPRLPPLLEPFQVEQRPELRGGVRHAEQQLAERPGQPGCHIAFQNLFARRQAGS